MKNLNELLNELVNSQVITENAKLLILNIAEREKIAYALEKIKEMEEILKANKIL